MRHALLACALLAASAPALADGFSYSYLDGRYQSFRGDDLNVDADGGVIAASLALGELLYVNARGTFAETDKFTELGGGSGTDEFFNAAVRLGAHHGISSALDVFAEVGATYERIEGTGDFRDDDESDGETGVSAAIGLRMQLAPRFEINGAYDYARIDEADEDYYAIGGEFKITEQFSAVAEAQFADDRDGYQAGVRYNF